MIWGSPQKMASLFRRRNKERCSNSKGHQYIAIVLATILLLQNIQPAIASTEIADPNLRDALQLENFSAYCTYIEYNLDKTLQTIVKELKTNNIVKSFAVNVSGAYYESSYDDDTADAWTHENGARAFADVIRLNKTIEEIDLNFLPSTYDADQGASIADALKVNKHIKTLKFRGFVGTEIADALLTNQTIKHLDLSGGSIENSGAKAIADAFLINNNLTYLDLRYNRIGSEGLKSIAESLKQNKSMKYIRFDLNYEPENDYIREIADALKNNKTLTFIGLHRINDDIQDETIKNERAKIIADIIKHNKTITYLDLSGNSFGDSEIKIIADALKTNKILTGISGIDDDRIIGSTDRYVDYDPIKIVNTPPPDCN